MNIYALVILVTIFFENILELVSSYLNIKNLSPILPARFRDYYEQDKYARSQKYLKETTAFGLISGSLQLFFLLGFWYTAGFNWLDVLVRSP